ncbi:MULTISPECIES: virulence-associated E family protein [Clostridium]|uniref:Virulence-associated E family protein n=1 Tax=Clostridium frigoriphilum TaxID=443253 RepID=A0ABU7UPY3_9CLOT|nr:virulence-associated E family protein [Clostridium sp. DSM 17811]MBU3100688.1 virulence-associated E family protein [Clostridium sp. DSM 17811]
MIISVADSKTAKHWKNIEMSWEEFLKRAKTTIRTTETVAEYKKLLKPKQDELKNVGGFVGGKLKEGKRKTGYVEHRSMLTLDMDYASVDIWEQLTLFYDFACCIYSTHKHTEEKPRLRLIIPLARVVTEEEYTAIGRKVAQSIGIEQFDDTTYQPARLMFWASTSSDGDFVFESQEGEHLDPDKILASYKDWRDTSSWPVSSRQTTIIKKAITKQSDPLEKPGVIGAFCRAYSIQDAIDTFIPDVYKPSVMEGRYDYIPADSVAGVLIYDDKFAFSHHATDPACSKLCNAFDIVRLHKYSELDGKASEDTSPTKLPSFKAMQEFAIADDKVKLQLAINRQAQVKADFTTEGDDWQTRLNVNKNGQIKDDLQNLVIIMQNDDNLKGIAYNQHRDGIDVKGTLDWKQIKCGWNDSDMSALKVYFDKSYGVWSPAKIKEALVAVAAERAYHPIKEYLDGLPNWDGIERLEILLIDYLGAEDNKYSRAVIRKTLVAAVARIYEPGTKFDSILILNGPQGIGKSTLFARLGSIWFSDSLTITDMRDKAAAEKLQGYWLLELGELAGIKKTDVETVKSFVSRTDDKYRASYGVNVESHPRQCVVVGSTNSESGFLRDITGNRRFWPVRVSGKSVKKAWELKEIDQIWSETLSVYRKGEDLFLKGDEAQIAMSEQADAMESDDREGLVLEYLEKLLPENWSSLNLYERRSFLSGGEFGGTAVGVIKRTLVCTMEIWCECFGKDSANLKKADSYEITAIIARIDKWKPYDGTKSGATRFPIYNKQRAFRRVE